ncbi:MAG: C40 family peptidase [Woronichinia naegeliana WA131]|uniref:C40 family peptidase n=1 Tax=Woronichinia naegeliana WA131 TaxID=2824559 RepID=A0A977PUW2_9CYAN|nr:MAG: C40 family peptidase [Woronichinia naegeliana WA131]
MSVTFPPTLPNSTNGEYCCQVALNLYDRPDCQTLATQPGVGRHLRLGEIQAEAILVHLLEDGYEAWLPLTDLIHLTSALTPYQAIAVDRPAIEAKIPDIIAYTQAARAIPNVYLWGGNLGPNYDCSGLIQAAFQASGIWLPRDSYQQEAFTERVAHREADLCEIAALRPGDLIFFGSQRVDHVALYLGENHYIHSSGKQMGRNGIGIDVLSAAGDEISQGYFRRWWSCGRVMKSYATG